MKLVPIVGDDSLRLPEYKFERATIKDFQAMGLIVTMSGAFPGVELDKFYAEAIRTLIMGYLIRDGDRIIGMACLSRVGGFPTVSYLYVDPLYRRKGLGWFLVNACLLRAIKNEFCEVHAFVPDDRPARKLFEKAGFKEAS